MCQECGCGLGDGAVTIGGHSHDHDHGVASHAHGGHAHASHSHPGGEGSRTLDLNRSLMEKNDRLAERNRGFFEAKNLLVLNVASSPGSGKTTLIHETATRLANSVRVGVIVGDLATDQDAARLREAGIPVVQITTGTICHLDADMVSQAAKQMDLDSLDVLIIENVGNLVCPADYDLGEKLRVILLSTTEGEDKPLKYPPMFHSANIAIITKSDLAEAAGFNREEALNNLKKVSHHAEILELSSKTGEGMDRWLDLLRSEQEALAAAAAVSSSPGA
jgi:hydrogenase nickel incorporation protein HypB